MDHAVALRLGEILAKRLKEEEDKLPSPVELLTHDKARFLLEAEWKPQRGDIVTLREDWPFPLENMRWPKIGDEVVITHVLDTPTFELMTDDTGAPVARADILIAFIHRCHQKDCKMEGALIEYYHDSRMFRRIGNVFTK